MAYRSQANEVNRPKGVAPCRVGQLSIQGTGQQQVHTLRVPRQNAHINHVEAALSSSPGQPMALDQPDHRLFIMLCWMNMVDKQDKRTIKSLGEVYSRTTGSFHP